MARKPRFSIPGIPQHVIQRGNNRDACFHAARDYRHYLEDLEFACEKYGCRIHAYALMTNHVHLLVTSDDEHGIPSMMQSLGRRYVRRFNATHERTGTLWEGRYRASLVDSDEYLLTCMRYIELNPVRASMVEHPGEYPWSSYSANAAGRSSTLVSPHSLYDSLGATPKERRRAYRDFVGNPGGETVDREIELAVSRELVLGRDGFKDEIARYARRPVRPGRVGRPGGMAAIESSD